MTRRFPPIFWIILIPFLIRLVFILTVPPAAIDLQADDASYYHLTALQIREYFQQIGPLTKEFLNGGLGKAGGILEKYGLEIPWGAFKRGPVYPFFVAVLYSLLGPHPLEVFIIQALLMSLAAGFLYGIAKELGQPKVGLGAAVLMGIYPPFIFIVDKLYQESLAVFLFSLFYFLVFRAWRKNSKRLWLAAGGALFLLSLSRTPLAFFCLFLFVGMLTLSRAWVLILSFLIPYGIWTGIVSWQFGHPAVVVEPVGREFFSALVPDYDGWTPDTFLDRRPDALAARVLKREGILESSSQPENLEWPSQPQLVSAALHILWKHPWISLRMAVEKFKRLWWQPYDWPWREFLFPSEPVRWFHRFLILTALLGGILWLFERPRALLFLGFPAAYGSVFHSFFHIESRYALTFMVFFPLFSAYFLYRPGPVRKVILGLTVFLPFLFHTFQETKAREWKTPLRDLGQGVRQEIFLPTDSLKDSSSQNLRLDLEIPQEAQAWGIWLNGEWLASLEALKTQAPAFLLKPPYQIYLRDMQKEFFQARQWFTLPLSKDVLKENDFNSIEIRAVEKNLGKPASGRKDWKIFGDDPFSTNPPIFSGPLFQRSPTETSVFSLWYLSDFRLKGQTPLHHGGVRSAFYDGSRWRSGRGEYRIRIEIEKPDGEFLVY